jgi:hypothetical protein
MVLPNKPMPSGKQILLEVLRELSQQRIETSDLETASERIRAGLLLHGSTGGDAWEAVEDVCWSSDYNEAGQVVRQGLALAEEKTFLADLFEETNYPDSIPEHVSRRFPQLTLEKYQRATRFMWLILSSVQWFEELSSVETTPLDPAEREQFIESYIRKLNHFRKHPEDFR